MMIRIKKHFIFAAITAVALFAVEANAQQGAIMAVDEPPAGAAAAVSSSVESNGKQARPGSVRTSTGRSSNRSRRQDRKRPSPTVGAKNTARQTAANKKYDGFMIGDKYTFLNFEVISAEKPYHTRAAKEKGAKGLVQVEILIDVDGNVLTAKARTGNKELWPEAERAALASKFNKPVFGGKPARANGFLVYRFGRDSD